MFRGFVSIDWGHVHFESETIPNPNKNMPTYLNQVRHALKSRLSPDARRASANSYLKTVMQALQDYTLTIWAGRNAALHAKTQDPELIVHVQLNADIRRLCKLKVSFADSAKQYFHLPLNTILSRPPRNRQRWRQLARLVAARASGRGTRQKISPPSISAAYPPAPFFPTDQFLLPVSLILTFVNHKLYSKTPRRSCACQNGPGPGRVNSLISNEVWRSIEFSR